MRSGIIRTRSGNDNKRTYVSISQVKEITVNNTRNGIIWQKVEDEVGISRTDIERDLIEGLEDGN